MKDKSYKNNNDTKKEALEMAKNYLQTLGFNGFSFQTIADALGIRKASLHYYFASKEDLGIALLKDYEIAHKEWIEKIKDLSSKEKLEKFSRIFTKMGENDWLVCPTGVLSTDFNTLPAKMKKKLKDFHLTQREKKNIMTSPDFLFNKESFDKVATMLNKKDPLPPKPAE